MRTETPVVADPAREEPSTQRGLSILRPVLVLLVIALLASPSSAEVSLSLVGGWGGTTSPEADLELGPETDLSYDAAEGSFLQYDARITWWTPRPTGWGLGLDLAWAASEIDLTPDLFFIAVQPPPDLALTSLEADLDAVTLHLLRRRVTRGTLGLPLVLYGGGGIGALVPEIRGRIGTREIDSRELAGPRLEAVLGLESELDPGIGLTLEARVHYSRLAVDLPRSSSIDADFWGASLLFGITLRNGPLPGT